MRNFRLLAVARIYDDFKYLETKELSADLDAREWHDISGWYNYGAEVYDSVVRELERKRDEILSKVNSPFPKAFRDAPLAPELLVYNLLIETEYEDPEDDEWYHRDVCVSIYIALF